MDKTIADTLVLQALRQAILRRSPPKKLICHSDRGVQYAGNDSKALLAQTDYILSHLILFCVRAQTATTFSFLIYMTIKKFLLTEV